MFFFVLSSIARSSISIGLLDRPLVAALLYGFATNSLEFALPLGAVLELFWLDILRLGAIIPPSGTLSFLLLYPLCLIFNWQAPSQFAIPLLVCLPLAYTIKWVESLQREQNNAQIAEVENWVNNPKTGNSPQKVIYISLLRFICFETLHYMTLFGLLFFIFHTLEHNHIFIISGITWSVIFSISLMGAVLALRTRRAYAILCLALVIAYFW